MTLQHQLRPVVLSNLAIDGVCSILWSWTDLNRALGFAASLAVRHHNASLVESSVFDLLVQADRASLIALNSTALVLSGSLLLA